jgi:hypothetical protein
MISKTLAANYQEDAKLYVITPIINPQRYNSRYKLYKKFEKMVNDSGAVLYTIEAAYGNRPFQVTTSDNPQNIQVRTISELWHKENMINVAVQRLPSNWEYVAWIDADVAFARPDWVEETIHQLQHHPVVQMFSTAVDLSPKHEMIKAHKGFVYSYLNRVHQKCDKYDHWHPGFAWAATKYAFNSFGGLIEEAILGSGDRHMAFGLVDKIEMTINKKFTQAYKRVLKKWETLAVEHIKKNIGYVEGTLLHYWHGKKKDRGYSWRSNVLVKNNYDPDTDIKKDWQGIYALTGNKIKFRDELVQYFKSRNEDSIDEEIC